MHLVTVIIKRSKLKATFPFWGGVLNQDAKYYVRRVTAKKNPQQHLNNIRGELHEQAA